MSPTKRAPVHLFCITITSVDVEYLEMVCNELNHSSSKKELKMKEPDCISIQTLLIITRKTPCSEGSKARDGFQMLILIDPLACRDRLLGQKHLNWP